MPRTLRIVLEGVAPFVVPGLLFGLLYNTLFYPRTFVYHGDVLNTAARIQAKCNEIGFDLLASQEALASLPPG